MGFRQIEWVLRSKLEAGLEQVRANPAYIDEMFQDLSDNSIAQLKSWLVRTDVNTVLSFPHYVVDFPCWAISLVGERPVHMPIGSSLDTVLDISTGRQLESQGEYVRKAYQIYTMSQNQDTTLVLATILQHTLKSARQDLTDLGFMELQCAQEDAAVLKVEHLPNFVYSRVTYLSVLVEDTFVYVDTQANTVAIGTQLSQESSGLIDVSFPV